MMFFVEPSAIPIDIAWPPFRPPESWTAMEDMEDMDRLCLNNHDIRFHQYRPGPDIEETG